MWKNSPDPLQNMWENCHSVQFESWSGKVKQNVTRKSFNQSAQREGELSVTNYLQEREGMPFVKSTNVGIESPLQLTSHWSWWIKLFRGKPESYWKALLWSRIQLSRIISLFKALWKSKEIVDLETKPNLKVVCSVDTNIPNYPLTSSKIF